MNFQNTTLRHLTITGHHALAVSILLGSIMGTVQAAPPVIFDLGATSGSEPFNAESVNGDGSVIAGSFYSAGKVHPFRWVLGSGVDELGDFSVGPISADGAAVVGSGPGSTAVLWTIHGLRNLGTLPGDRYSWPLGVSGDGSSVVGISDPYGGLSRAFKWDLHGGMRDLGNLGDGWGAEALAISADGSAVVGVSTNYHLFRWTTAGGIRDIGLPPGLNSDNLPSSVFNVSSSAVVGVVDQFGNSERIRWTLAGGMLDLGALPQLGGLWHLAAISADGSVVVGSVYATNSALLWTSTLGTVDLRAYLASLGVDVTGWTLGRAVGVSADGTAIVGQGMHFAQARSFLIRGLNLICAAPAAVPPSSLMLCPSGDAAFHVTAVGTAPFTYRWQIEAPPRGSETWIDISDGPLPLVTGSAAIVSGATTTDLAVHDIDQPAALRYRCRVANTCGTTTSTEATLDLCAADFDCNGFVTGDDYDTYVQAFVAGDSSTDYDGNGFVTGDDYDAFVAAFVEGC